MGSQVDVIRKKIDGETYVFTYLSPRRSLTLLTEITKLIGPAIGSMCDNGEIEEDKVSMGEAARLLCNNMNDNNIQSMINTLLSQVTHEGVGDVLKSFDVIFTGKIKHLFKVILASLEVQYADFFDGKGVVEGLRDLAKDSNLKA